MKVGYTSHEAYHMFRSLRREVFNYFGYDRPISFGVRSPSTGIFSLGAIAHANFSDDPDKPYEWGDRIIEFASGIRMNADYLPFVYEDELRCILLHELTHVTAGFTARHGWEWRRQCAEVGAIPSPEFIIRKHRVMDHRSPSWLVPTMEYWKDRALL